MFLLPVKAGLLARHTSEDGRQRYGTAGVLVRFLPDRFEVAATDCKHLIVLRGDNPPVADFPAPDVMANAPNGRSDALVPADALKGVCDEVQKLTRAAARGGRPILRNVAVQPSEKVTTFAGTDATRHVSRQVENVEGRFPPIDNILERPKDGRSIKVRVDGKMLADLLTTLVKLGEGDLECNAVELEVFADGKPVRFFAKYPDGTIAEALQMPLTD